MITNADIADIIYARCSDMRIEDQYLDGAIPEGKVERERIAIHTKRQTSTKYWIPTTVEVNIDIPDRDGMADIDRIQELERLADEVFPIKRRFVGEYGKDVYRCKANGRQTLEDKELQCHFINIQLNFESLNILN